MAEPARMRRPTTQGVQRLQQITRSGSTGSARGIRWAGRPAGSGLPRVEVESPGILTGPYSSPREAGESEPFPAAARGRRR